MILVFVARKQKGLYNDPIAYFVPDIFVISSGLFQYPYIKRCEGSIYSG